MYRLLVVYLFITAAKCITDVDKQCIEDNSEPLSNDFLLGTWYRVYRFAPGATLPPSCSCIKDEFSRPTPDIVQEYKDKYNDPDLPYSLDDNPVLKNNRDWKGMVIGNQRAKFHVLTPTTTAWIPDDFAVIAYKPFNDKYLMTTECAMRGNLRWLLSRSNDSTLEEVHEIIKKTPEYQRLDGQRFCAVDKYCLALPSL